MKNANLVPKKITDKNGVVSTRWVKPEQTTGLASPIPAPAPVAVTEFTYADDNAIHMAEMLYQTEVGDGIDEDDEDDPGLAEMQDAVETFRSYPAEVVDEIIQDAEYGKMWGLKNLMNEDAPVEQVRDYLNLFNYIKVIGLDDDGNGHNIIIKTAGAYEGLESVTATGIYPEKRKQQLQGLLGGVSSLWGLTLDGSANRNVIKGDWENGVPTIADERISALLINRPENGEAILNFIEERKTADYHRIIEYLESEAPAISAGVL